MDIKDRGTIKWTAMMLPEHVELLKQLEHEQQKVKKPELDEQAGRRSKKRCVKRWRTIIPCFLSIGRMVLYTKFLEGFTTLTSRKESFIL